MAEKSPKGRPRGNMVSIITPGLPSRKTDWHEKDIGIQLGLDSRLPN
jgi:hypothetical protein